MKTHWVGFPYSISVSLNHSWLQGGRLLKASNKKLINKDICIHIKQKKQANNNNIKTVGGERNLPCWPQVKGSVSVVVCPNRKDSRRPALASSVYSGFTRTLLLNAKLTSKSQISTSMLNTSHKSKSLTGQMYSEATVYSEPPTEERLWVSSLMLRSHHIGHAFGVSAALVHDSCVIHQQNIDFPNCWIYIYE